MCHSFAGIVVGSDIEWAGGLNVVGDTGDQVSMGQVSKEQIIKWNPDVILIHFGSLEKIEAIARSRFTKCKR